MSFLKKKKLLIFLTAGLLILLLFGCQNKKPYMSFVIELEDAPPITRGFLDRSINAYYRGFKVGKVTKVKLAKNQKSVQLYLDIYYKNLMLPENTDIEFGTENFLGRKFINLIYPTEPVNDLITNGEILKGRANRFFRELDEFMEKELETKRLGKMLSNLENITHNLNEIMTDNKSEINSFIKDMQKTSQNMNLALNDLRELSSDPKVKKDIKSSINNTAKSLEELNSIIEGAENNENLKEAPSKINSALNNFNKVSENLDKTNKLLCSTNKNMNCLNKKIPEESLKNVDCMSKGVSCLLSKRFLLFRFMFGNPGKCLKECDE